ncbi:MAG: hypothetical protein AAB628_01325 [Patescibacteria group bacterium]
MIPIVLTVVLLWTIALAFRHKEIGAVFSASFLTTMTIASGLVEAGII